MKFYIVDLIEAGIRLEDWQDHSWQYHAQDDCVEIPPGAMLTWTLLKNPQPQCWKNDPDMMAWAPDHGAHGMGDLTQSCRPRPGTSCPACGRVWRE